jgi:hypothetical protein
MLHFFTAPPNRKPPTVVGTRTVELTLRDELDDAVREAWRRLVAASRSRTESARISAAPRFGSPR